MRRPHPTRLSLTWLGHSTAVLELDGTRIITDPLLRTKVAHLVRPRESTPDAAAQAPDVVLCSHAHRDHLDFPSLRALPKDALVAVPRGLGRRVQRLGFREVVEVVEGDEVRTGSLSISVTHAEHAAGRGAVRRGAAPVGYLIHGSLTAYFAGDTDLFPGMSAFPEELDLALLPVSGWGPRVPAGHLNPVRAVAALQRLKPRVAVPIHWGTYRPRYRRTPYDVDVGAGERFAAVARANAPEVDVRVLQPGERTIVAPKRRVDELGLPASSRHARAHVGEA
jgi:L-ascorbate metabolism protein UlaG (beta-lactamase superfamily)